MMYKLLEGHLRTAAKDTGRPLVKFEATLAHIRAQLTAEFGVDPLSVGARFKDDEDDDEDDRKEKLKAARAAAKKARDGRRDEL